MKKLFTIAAALLIILTSCSENYSNGERIGVITQFSETGLIWKSWEGHLNVTQTGMNSSVPFDFSIDNDNPDNDVTRTIDSAAQYGWKVKLVYHEVAGFNIWKNRGETDHFVTEVQVLEKDFGNVFNGKNNTTPVTNTVTPTPQRITGRTIDTIYVVIYRDKP